MEETQAKLTQIRQIIADTEARLRGVLSADEVEKALAPMRQEEQSLVEELGLPVANTAVTAQTFWQQFPDVQDDALIAATDRYLNYLIGRYSYLDFRGIGIVERVPKRVGLLNMFVPRAVRPFLSENDSHHDTPDLQNPVPILPLLGEQAGTVVLGGTGSGKTTLLKYVALALASGQLSDVEGLNGRIPLILPLSNYADALHEARIPLQQFITNYFDSLSPDLPLGNMFSQIVQRGKGLLLLDGLDEVRDLQMRFYVVSQIADFFAIHKQVGNKLVVTSRLLGYREARLILDDIEEVTLADLDDAAMTRFVRNWTTAVSTPQDPTPPPNLLPTIKQNHALHNLAGNPLLLTIMLLMNQQHIPLPERRVELYDQYLKTLLKFWQLARTAQRTDPVAIDSLNNTLHLLAPLALWMEEGSSGIGSVQVQDALRQLISICQLRKIPNPEETAAQFLQDMRLFTGVITDLGNGRIAFLHRAFQQYLAAWAIAQLGQSDLSSVHDFFETRMQDVQRWELLRLAVGILGIVQQREEAAAQVLQRAITAEIGQNGAGSALVGQTMGDIAPIGLTNDAYEELLSQLHRDIQNESFNAQWRISIGRSLGRLGEGLTAVHTLNLCLIPPSDFILGESHYAQTVTDLNKPYWLSQHPISNHQFNQFIEAGGYYNEAYWEQAAAVSRWQSGETMDWERLGWRKRPFAYDFPFTLPNHPIVGITWYEAAAFCAWLTEMWRADDLIPQSWTVSLPSEIEWEKAAKGGVQIPRAPVVADPVNILPITDSFFEKLVENEGAERPFPWGNTSPTNRANFYQETGLFADGTNAAGCFPNGESPYGCVDMSGNIWEWTRSVQQRYPYDPADGREPEAVKLFHTMTLRGGAFWSNAQNIRTTARIGRSPNSRSDSYGFRICIRTY